jgi:transcriptional regulator with XRE-family HTH domain
VGLSPFGEFIKSKRLAAELSLRDVADAVGVSHVYVGEVERGRRRSMPKEHWKALAKAIPGVTEKELRIRAALSAPLDPSELEGRERDVVVALARRIETKPLTETEFTRLLEILSGGDR